MPIDLILIGASTRAAAWSAYRAGFSPYSIDLFADVDTAELGPAVRITDYPAGFLRALEAAPQAPWIYTGGLENYPDLVDRLAQIRPLWGNAGNVLRRVRDPFVLATALGEAGFAFPETRPQLPADLALEDCRQWLKKPLHSSGGMGVRFAKASDAGGGDAGRSEAYFQRFVPGQAGSAMFVALATTTTYLCATRQLLGQDWNLTRPFQYVGSIMPASGPLAELRRLGTLLQRQFGLVGLFGVDFVLAGDQMWVIEVNPRYTSAMEIFERSAGVNMLALHARTCSRTLAILPSSSVPQPCRPRSTDSPGLALYVGKAIVFAPTKLTVPPSWNDFRAAQRQDCEFPLVADIPRVGDTIEAGDPICTVFADGPSRDEVEGSLRQRSAAVVKAMDAS
jgi:predicted ATP-grasp superfamily ATP-dependent carboligase